jgi:hypothetical protein
LMPIYNGAATLGETLASLSEQSKGVEIILVDQGSTDGSPGVAEKFTDRIDLKLVSAPENENWVQNTNVALGMARAPRACLLHQDDLWRPGRADLLRQMFARDPDAAMWLHGADFIDHAGRAVGCFCPPFGPRFRRVESDESLRRLLVQNTIALPAVAFPVVAARDIGGLDERLWYTADWDLWLGLARRGATSWSPESAASFRVHPNSLTLSGSQDLAELAEQLRKPVERHLPALPDPIRRRIERRSQASNLVNVWLASAFHGQRRPLKPVAAALLQLGPTGLMAYLRDSRLFARVSPRLHLLAPR